jgi:hypothetical protein
MITQKKRIIAATQLNYEVLNLRILNDFQSGWGSIVTYRVTNQNGEPMPDVVLEYSGEAYNEWWKNFTSGKSLIENLIAQQEITTDIPEDIEDYFLNQPKKETDESNI